MARKRHDEEEKHPEPVFRDSYDDVDEVENVADEGASVDSDDIEIDIEESEEIDELEEEEDLNPVMQNCVNGLEKEILTTPETLKGDIRDFMLDRFKNLPKTWKEMTEMEQRGLIQATEEAAINLIKTAVRQVARDGRKVVEARLEQVVIKDGIKAVMKASSDSPYKFELIEAQGKSCLIVVADACDYMGQKAEAKPEPDQRSLIEDEDDKPVFDNSNCAKEREPKDIKVAQKESEINQSQPDPFEEVA
jgi:hypothetical protein